MYDECLNLCFFDLFVFFFFKSTTYIFNYLSFVYSLFRRLIKIKIYKIIQLKINKKDNLQITFSKLKKNLRSYALHSATHIKYTLHVILQKYCRHVKRNACDSYETRERKE